MAEAHGRYIVCQSGLYDPKFAAEVLAKRFPQYKFGATKTANQMPGFDTTKVRLAFLGTNESPTELFVCCLSCGQHACGLDMSPLGALQHWGVPAGCLCVLKALRMHAAGSDTGSTLDMPPAAADPQGAGHDPDAHRGNLHRHGDYHDRCRCRQAQEQVRAAGPDRGSGRTAAFL